MADYLMTIPGVADGLELSSLQMGHDNQSVVITMAVSDIATWLWQAAVEGRSIEFVGILGYYVLISMILNVFRMSPPEGVSLPFAETA